jgi:hypothetical protein
MVGISPAGKSQASWHAGNLTSFHALVNIKDSRPLYSTDRGQLPVRLSGGSD